MPHAVGDATVLDQCQSAVGEGVEPEVGVPEPLRDPCRLCDERRSPRRIVRVQGAGQGDPTGFRALARLLRQVRGAFDPALGDRAVAEEREVVEGDLVRRDVRRAAQVALGAQEREGTLPQGQGRRVVAGLGAATRTLLEPCGVLVPHPLIIDPGPDPGWVICPMLRGPPPGTVVGHHQEATMATAETFQITAEQAETYEERFVPALFAHWVDAVLDAAGVRAGQRVLDVGCGTGIVGPARVGPRGAHRARHRAGPEPGDARRRVAGPARPYVAPRRRGGAAVRRRLVRRRDVPGRRDVLPRPRRRACGRWDA